MQMRLKTELEEVKFFINTRSRRLLTNRFLVVLSSLDFSTQPSSARTMHVHLQEQAECEDENKFCNQ
jgi:hypothetical protein